jgi:hypothetical protein
MDQPWHMKLGTLLAFISRSDLIASRGTVPGWCSHSDEIHRYSSLGEIGTGRTYRWKMAFLYPCGLEFTLTIFRTQFERIRVRKRHLYSPVHSCLKFSAVLYPPKHQNLLEDESEWHDLGTTSLNSSIFIRPAGVSPMLISKNTMGRVGFDILCPESRVQSGKKRAGAEFTLRSG